MKSSNLYSKLLNAPKNAPVFLSQNLEADFIVLYFWSIPMDK